VLPAVCADEQRLAAERQVQHGGFVHDCVSTSRSSGSPGVAVEGRAVRSAWRSSPCALPRPWWPAAALRRHVVLQQPAAP
jgi:hypothetical protein